MNKIQLTALDQTTIKLIDGDRGSNYPKKSDFSKKGYCLFLDSSNLTKNGFDFTSTSFISENKDNAMGNGKVQTDDLVMNTRGTLGNIGHYTKQVPFKHIRINSGMLIIRGGEEYTQNFLYVFFRSKLFFAQVENIMSGSVQKQLPVWIFNFIKVPKLDIPTQEKIASVIAALDKKIELNNKINAELEEMAKTLYNYRFVQFDFPNKNGKPYKSSGGEMVWSDELKREIPKGWEVKRVDQIESNIITGKTPSTKVSENFNGEIPFICIGDVRGDMHIVKTEATLSKKGAETQKNKYISEGSICVTCIASPGLVGFATEESQTNQQLNSIVCEKFENRHYLYFYLQDYFKYAKAKSGNTFANMNKEDFSSIKTIKPNDEILLKFADIIQPSIDKILTNTKENQKLAELRDWLLPMLMNGQVTVN